MTTTIRPNRHAEPQNLGAARFPISRLDAIEAFYQFVRLLPLDERAAGTNLATTWLTYEGRTDHHKALYLIDRCGSECYAAGVAAARYLDAQAAAS